MISSLIALSFLSVSAPAAEDATSNIDLGDDLLHQGASRSIAALPNPFHGERCVFFLDMESPDRGTYGGTDAQRSALLQELDKDWGEFNVEFYTEQPNEPHQACNIGYDDCPNYSNPTGQAGMDCHDGGGYGDNCWAAVCGGQIIPVNFQASIIGQELAHTFGLDHSTGKPDILNPNLDGNGPDPIFNNECLDLASNYCDHSQFCPGGGQNSYMEIASHCGEAAPDMGDPTVEITFPSNGDVFQECDDFGIEADATDDKRVQQVTLLEDGQTVATDSAEPWSWEVRDIPPGEYVFSAVALDTAGNEGQSEIVRITVEPTGEDCSADGDDPDQPDPGPNPGSDDGAGDGPGGTGDHPGNDDDMWPDGAADERRDAGCGCAAPNPHERRALLVTCLVVMGAARRRPSTRP